LSTLFLSVALTVSSVSLNNLMILVSITFFAVLFQMHFYRVYCGDVAFYLMLPVKRTRLVPILAVNSTVPIIFALLLYSCIRMLFHPTAQTGIHSISLFDKLMYLFVVLVIIKVLPLPLAILFKKHVALVPLFLCMSGFLYLFLSLIRELISGIVHINNPTMAFLFLASIVFISTKIFIKASI
jgi:hypothetical protein